MRSNQQMTKASMWVIFKFKSIRLLTCLVRLHYLRFTGDSVTYPGSYPSGSCGVWNDLRLGGGGVVSRECRVYVTCASRARRATDPPSPHVSPFPLNTSTTTRSFPLAARTESGPAVGFPVLSLSQVQGEAASWRGTVLTCGERERMA